MWCFEPLACSEGLIAAAAVKDRQRCEDARLLDLRAGHAAVDHVGLLDEEVGLLDPLAGALGGDIFVSLAVGLGEVLRQTDVKLHGVDEVHLVLSQGVVDVR